MAIIGGLSGEDKTKESNDSPANTNTEVKATNPPAQNNQISEYQRVLESYKSLKLQNTKVGCLFSSIQVII